MSKPCLRGEFLFYNGERIERLGFPKFNGSRANEIKRTVLKKKPKEPNLWNKLKAAFNQNHNTNNKEEHDSVYGNTWEDEDDEFVEELDTMFDEDEFIPL